MAAMAALVATGIVFLGASAPAVAADKTASVNADPMGVWSTPTLAFSHRSSVIGASDQYGCPSTYGCGWVDARFGTPMGRWHDNNSDFSVFSEPACNVVPGFQNWNDCVSSIDNNKGPSCYFTWFWNTNYGSTRWVERYQVAHGSIGTSNDQFSSDKSCTDSNGN
jgi:hypothetical protein